MRSGRALGSISLHLFSQDSALTYGHNGWDKYLAVESKPAISPGAAAEAPLTALAVAINTWLPCAQRACQCPTSLLSGLSRYKSLHYSPEQCEASAAHSQAIFSPAPLTADVYVTFSPLAGIPWRLVVARSAERPVIFTRCGFCCGIRRVKTFTGVDARPWVPVQASSSL